MGALANEWINGRVDDIAGRVMRVRHAAVTTSSWRADCSACGELTGRLRHGISIHAVENAGHIVTVTQVISTVYQDETNGGSGATGTQEQG